MQSVDLLGSASSLGIEAERPFRNAKRDSEFAHNRAVRIDNRQSLALSFLASFLVLAASYSVPDVQASTIAAGTSHSCAIRNSSTYCWGGPNSAGIIGDGTLVQRTTPTRIGLVNATAVTAGTTFTCALISGGTVSCWGMNTVGQIGDGTTTTRTIPTAVAMLSSVVHVDSGIDHSCAVRSDGTAACWGSNFRGQLGDGTTVDRSIPVSVLGLSGAAKIASGRQHSCALLDGGSVVCWGSNSHGKLGDGTSTDRYVPVAVVGLAGAIDITAGYDQTCALRANGTIVCWGLNNLGQLGDNWGAYPSASTPVSVLNTSGTATLSAATAVSAGHTYTCARMSDGSLVCWGSNSDGQLGYTGGINYSKIPVVVSGAGGIGEIATGAAHNCSFVPAGLACWGKNANGQLGIGTLTSTHIPTLLDFGEPLFFDGFE